MKKLIVWALSAMMVLSAIPALALTASAEEIYTFPDPDEGLWSTYREPLYYGESLKNTYIPAAGFQYTKEGLQILSPDFTGQDTRVVAQTSEPVDLREGFYMQVRVDDFSYGGEDNVDEWIAISVSDRPLVAVGLPNFGNNWSGLIRGKGNGKATIESFVTDMDEGSFSFKGDKDITVPLDDEDREIYTFAIVYDDITRTSLLQVNGVTVEGMDEIYPHISSFQDCYVGLTFHSKVTGGTASATIIKQGTTKSDAVVPKGTNSKAPEENPLLAAPIADPDSVSKNTPALLFNALNSASVAHPEVTGAQLRLNADLGYHMTAQGSEPSIRWTVNRDNAYRASDFSAVAVLVRNFRVENGQLALSMGAVTDPYANTVTLAWDRDDIRERFTFGGDEYSVLILDASAVATEERISALQMLFDVSPSAVDSHEWDIQFVAAFRSAAEAVAYAEAYMDELGYEPPVETPPAETPAEVVVTEPETEAPDPLADCTIIIGGSSALLGLVIAGAALSLRKKEQ